MVRYNAVAQERIRATLEQFWKASEETVRMPRSTLYRVKQTARAVLLEGLTPTVRKELEWVLNL